MRRSSRGPWRRLSHGLCANGKAKPVNRGHQSFTAVATPKLASLGRQMALSRPTPERRARTLDAPGCAVQISRRRAVRTGTRILLPIGRERLTPVLEPTNSTVDFAAGAVGRGRRQQCPITTTKRTGWDRSPLFLLPSPPMLDGSHSFTAGRPELLTSLFAYTRSHPLASGANTPRFGGIDAGWPRTSNARCMPPQSRA